jgi:hypothetical protein
MQVISIHSKSRGGLQVDRKLMIVAVCALAALSAAASAAFGQEQQKAKPQLRIQHATKNSQHADAAEAEKNRVAAGSSSKTPALPLFTYSVDSDRDGNTYTGVMVGADPFSKHGEKDVSVKTFIVPIVVTLNTVGVSTDFNTGDFATAPGVTVLDPTANDNSCLAAPNNNPLKLFQHTPMFDNYDISVGGVDMGHTQYIDAFQRAEFWNVLKDRDDYHLMLDPVRTLPAFALNVPADQGLTLPAADFPACGPFGIIDIDFFDLYINNTVLPALAPQVNAGNFPIFMLYNTVLAFTPQTNLFNCCVLGYHGTTNALPLGTYSPSDFDTTGLFGSTQGDANTLSHEVGEWANDPFGNNPTPAWGHTGQVVGCQGNLEVGDPLSGTNFSPIAGRNGYTYHLQELAFFSWFFSSQSTGVGGFFSDNDTFTTDAGPVCVAAASSTARPGSMFHPTSK